VPLLRHGWRDGLAVEVAAILIVRHKLLLGANVASTVQAKATGKGPSVETVFIWHFGVA